MKAIQSWVWCLALSLIALTACEDDSENDFAFQFDYNFATSQNGWSGDFADYPVGEETFYELAFAHDTLPRPLDKTRKALKFHGVNRSDDLFFFAKKRLTGLAPNTEYSVFFEFELASNFPLNSVGIGGGPGAATYIKAGAAATEPKKVARNNLYEFNLEKGNQSQVGKNAVALGTLGISGNEFVYKLIRRSSGEKPLTAKTDGEGNLWVFVGVDSGFEGAHTFYITKAVIRLK